MNHYRFSLTKDIEFTKALTARVNEYFKSNQLKKSANQKMVYKAMLSLSLYFLPFILLISGMVTNPWLALGLFLIQGLGITSVGTNVMHESLHESLAPTKRLNHLLGLSAYVIGADALMWKIQHNVLHHSYTNIEGADDDLDPRFVMRFTPHQKKLWFHKFQHIYATLMYCFITLMWVTVKDINKWNDYKKKGLLPKDKNPFGLLALIVIRKLSYFAIFLVLPMVVLPFSPWLTLGMFLVMHAFAGVMLSFVFQSAHVVPGTAFIQQESNKIDENRFTHQLMTTANFARNSTVFFWLFGGLNFQIEHHMFPNICHIHYPKMSEIVEKTAQEFGMDYRINATFGTAIAAHLRLLKQLGQAA